MLLRSHLSVESSSAQIVSNRSARTGKSSKCGEDRISLSPAGIAPMPSKWNHSEAPCLGNPAVAVRVPVCLRDLVQVLMHAVRRRIPHVEQLTELVAPPGADERQQRPSLRSDIGERTHEYQLVLQETE